MICKKQFALARVVVFVLASLTCSCAADAQVQAKAGQAGIEAPLFVEANERVYFQLGYDPFKEVLSPVREARDESARKMQRNRAAQSLNGLSNLVEMLNREDVYVDACITSRFDEPGKWEAIATSNSKNYERFRLTMTMRVGPAGGSPSLVLYIGNKVIQLTPSEKTVCLQLWCKRWLEQRLIAAGSQISDEQEAEFVSRIAAKKIVRVFEDARDKCMRVEWPMPLDEFDVMVNEMQESLAGRNSLIRKYLNSEIAKHNAATAAK